MENCQMRLTEGKWKGEDSFLGKEIPYDRKKILRPTASRRLGTCN